MSSVLTVTQVNKYIKSIFDGDGNLQGVYVTGEISNFTNHYRTGHLYFTLKDENAAVKAVMFRSAAQRLRFVPENGMKVVIRGNISVFERDGAYQLYAEDIAPDGTGALSLAFEQMKKKLFARGWFDEENKKPIPRFPDKIGVVTSPTGAAVRDIVSVIKRRYPIAQIVLEPVQVQGDSAAPQIIAAIEKLNKAGECDVLIVGRGGGSIEDLWAFNEEAVARAIFESEIPVISAVGHETDFTISDFVADLRAPTPSAGAELAVPDWREVMYALDKMLDSMTETIQNKISMSKYRLLSAQNILYAKSPLKRIEFYSKQTDFLSEKLARALDSTFERYKNLISRHAQQLDSLSPLKILAKGYCIATDEFGNTVDSVKMLRCGDSVSLRLTDGSAQCRIVETAET